MKHHPLIHKFKTAANHYVYDVNTNNIMRTNEILHDVIDGYGTIPFSAIASKWAKKYDAKSIEQCLTHIQESCKSQGVFSSNRPTVMKYPMCEHHFYESLQGGLSDLTLNATERCNLRCKYCTYSGAYYYERHHSTEDMSWETAKKAIDYFYSHTQSSEKVYMSFFGGEPLLNFDLVKRSVEYATGFANWPPIVFHLDTNGTILSDETSGFLIENDVILQVSIDGPFEIHDRYRVFGNGGGTFHLVHKNLERIRKMDRDYYESRVSFAATLAPPCELLETYRFFSSDDLVAKNNLNINFVDTYDTDFFRMLHDRVRRSRLSEHLGALRKEYLEVTVGSNSGPAHQFLKGLFERPLVRIHRRALNPMGAHCPPNGICVPGVRRLFVDVAGRFYPCEKVGQAFCIGHVDTGIEYSKVRSLLEQYIRGSTQDCTSCWAVRLCSLCLAQARRSRDLDFGRKKDNCSVERANLHDSLVLYAEIMERNPKAFDFVEDMVFE